MHFSDHDATPDKSLGNWPMSSIDFGGAVKVFSKSTIDCGAIKAMIVKSIVGSAGMLKKNLLKRAFSTKFLSSVDFKSDLRSKTKK